jgi:hypothetical protein
VGSRIRDNYYFAGFSKTLIIITDFLVVKVGAVDSEEDGNGEQEEAYNFVVDMLTT